MPCFAARRSVARRWAAQRAAVRQSAMAGLVALALLAIVALDVLAVHRRPAAAAASAATVNRAVQAARPPDVRRGPAPVLRAPVSRPRRLVTTRGAAAVDPWARFGFDISWPQCAPGGPVLPPALGSTAIVGITNGSPFTSNHCLGAEWAWARSRPHHSAYINLAFPMTAVDPASYGAATVRDALVRARAAGLQVHGAWLDVEVGNYWSGNRAANLAVISGAVTALQQAQLQPGLYSTPLDWAQITGGASVSLPVWQALPDGRRIAQGCDSSGIGGRRPDLVQAVFSTHGHNVDGDLLCTVQPDFSRVLG